MTRQHPHRRSSIRRALSAGAVATAAWLAGQAGCGSSGGVSTSAHEKSPDASVVHPDPDPMPGFGAEGGTGLSVQVTPSGPTICPGQCVQLAASASNGVAPYTYAWDNGVTPDGGAATVCPTTTTTYSVSATDSSGQAGELAHGAATATAQATVTVQAQCADGGAPAHEICSRTWSGSTQGYWGWWSYGNTVATDRSGNIYFATDVAGTVTIDGHDLPGKGVYDLLIVKLDSQCNVLWTKRFGGGPTSAIYDAGLAVDGSGNLIIAGYFQSTINLGLSDLIPLSEEDAFVAKLGPDGTTQWQKTYGDNGLLSETSITGVAADSAGNVAFVGWSTSAVDLGGGLLGTLGSANPGFIGKLNPDGSLAFAKTVPSVGLGSASSAYGVAIRDGAVWVAGYESDSVATADGGSVDTLASTVALDASGNVRWKTSIHAPMNSNTWWGAGIGLDSANDVVQLEGWGYQDVFADGGTNFTSERTLHRVSASGMPGWQTTAAQLNAIDPSNGGWWWGWGGWGGGNGLYVGPAGDSIVTSAFSGSLDVSPLPALRSAGSTDVAILGFDPDGHLSRAARWGSADGELPIGTTADATGNPIVAGWLLPAADLDYDASAAPPSITNYKIFVTKLGW